MREPDANGWMPIESAPKDGSEILVCVTYNLSSDEWETMTWVDWEAPPHIWPVYRSRIDIPFPPTHWQPLPKPPVETQPNDHTS